MVLTLAKTSEKNSQSNNLRADWSYIQARLQNWNYHGSINSSLPLNQTVILSLSVGFDIVDHKILLWGHRVTTTIPCTVPKSLEALHRAA